MKQEINKQQQKVENVVVIGSGPAGYTSAIYAARARLKPLLITGFKSGGIQGGQLMTTTYVENFPGFPEGIMGPELMDRVKAQAIRWGSELVEADAKKIDLTKHPFEIEADRKLIKAHSLIIATGASANRLGLPKEQEFWSKGISACAICDGATPQFRNESLAVVGGGDSACEEALYLTKYGSHVHLLVRSNNLRASTALAEKVIDNPSITIHWESNVIDAEGDDWLTGLRFISRHNNHQEKILEIKGLFYAIGHTPNTELVKGQIATDPSGYILTEPGSPKTSINGVFAAGDVADSEWRQAITAAGSGCKAALAAERWLSNNQLITLIDKESLNQLKNTEQILTSPTPISTKENYQPNAIWQKGSYALRRLYHESERPILVVYTSPNCGPCHVLKPQLKRILKELNGTAQGVEINIEDDFPVSQQAGIKGTPTIQLFKLKLLTNQWQGVKQRSEFKKAIEMLLKQ